MYSVHLTVMSARAVSVLLTLLFLCCGTCAQPLNILSVRKKGGAVEIFGRQNLTRILVNSGLAGQQSTDELARLLDSDDDLVCTSLQASVWSRSRPSAVHSSCRAHMDTEVRDCMYTLLISGGNGVLHAQFMHSLMWNFHSTRSALRQQTRHPHPVA